SMTPTWLIILSVLSLVLAIASAASILIDILARQRPMMTVMKWVWPITALYMGPLALWAYWTMGRSSAREMHGMDDVPEADHASHEQERPFWQSVFLSTTHCGAGCSLGDLIAEWVVFWLGVTLAGRALWPEYIGDYTLAYLLGIAFQFFAIVPMRQLTVGAGIREAVKADTLSLTAFEVGLFGWMALMAFVFFHSPMRPDSVVYWFMMQIGMIIGFATSYPMNWVLVRRGVKEGM
ncbi:MAG: DUF4396 domain-containing protein, partial [Chloroflexota bacterium]